MASEGNLNYLGDGNGSYVSRAEMMAHLSPIRRDVAEIRMDVKSLLVSAAATQAVQFDARSRWSLRGEKATLLIGLVAIASLALSIYLGVR